ncbi:HNH endonuclease signature motif containing protein [Brucella anthropi]|uniref:HNH endonuclease signature motif containing protein n=1 Tax=Brucella anthropi TaxID=529 RepID=UPI000DFD348D|nr:Uncharacterised protein [Brucella anthropi]
MAEWCCNAWNKRYAGTKIGRLSKGYIEARILGKMYGMHRVIWLYMTGKWPLLVDHINGNPSDNRWKKSQRGPTRQQTIKTYGNVVIISLEPRAFTFKKAPVNGNPRSNHRASITISAHIKNEKTLSLREKSLRSALGSTLITGGSNG